MGNVRKHATFLCLEIIIGSIFGLLQHFKIVSPVVAYTFAITASLIVLFCLYWREIKTVFGFASSSNGSQKPVFETWRGVFDEFKQGSLFAFTVLFALLILLVQCEAQLSGYLYGREWVHPYLSADEVRKAEDACVMKAYEAIGGGDYDRDDRQDYIDSCMERQDFTRRQVEP